MKTLVILLSVLITLFLLESCSVEEMEPSRKQIRENLDYPDAMMLRDSISKEGDEIDPPKSGTPPIKI